MSNLWMEIEALVLDGVQMDRTQGRRLKQLTEAALTRLLEQRGAGARLDDGVEDNAASPDRMTGDMRSPANPNEARWAEDIALAVYRAMDRTF